jgi:regulator of cell morphogenesis and NO signaling
MKFDPNTKIGDIVLKHPETMRVFEAMNVDYCCGGQRSLDAACAHAGQGLTAVLTRLEQMAAPDPTGAEPGTWEKAPLVAMIAHIEATHHAFTRSELARLAPLMAKVLQVHGEHYPELARIAELFQAMHDDLLPHLDKEERILFPFIRSMESGQPGHACFGTVQSPIQAMQMEHEAVGDILRELRTLTADYSAPADACGSFRSLYLGLHTLEEDLHLHIYLESHLLFPRAIALETSISGSGK